jgi:S-adenosylmethionine uptake transporter
MAEFMASPRHPDPLVPFAVATAGIALFSAMDAVMKGLSLAIGAYNALLWRTMAGAIFGGILFVLRRQKWPGRAAMRIHLERGVLSAAMAILFFWGLARVPLAQGVALAFIAPIIALYLAALHLGETIERRAILASILGFIGVVVILSAQAQARLGPDALRGAIAILASATLYAWNIILMRKQALVARPVEIAFLMSLIMSLCFLAAAPWLAFFPAPPHLPAVAGAALLAFASLLLLSWAYARAEAQHLAPVEYGAFVWASLFGIAVFHEPVRPLTLIGASLIVGACLIAARGRPSPVANLEAAI